MKLQSRLLACFSVLIVMLVVLGARAWWSAASQQQTFDGFSRETVASTSTLDEVRAALLNSRRLEKDIVISSGFSQKVAAQRKLWEAEQATMTRLLAALADASVERRGEASAVTGSIKRYGELARPTFDAAAAGTLNNAGEAVDALAPATEAAGDAQARIARWRQELREKGDVEVARAAQRYRTDVAFTITIVAAAVAATALMGVALARSIVVPLRSATRLTRDIGAGNFCGQLTPRGHDEVAELGRGLLAMQGSLRVLVGQLHESTSSIGTATAQIAAGNQDLANRTEQTAANLQRTTSSMSELSATVSHAASLACDADQHAAAASALARRGGAIVDEVVQTMARMQKASQRIGDIIGVVDSISFQTNILALNAAVEAARAGDQGRGFSVVAAEVRSLAQRSTAAAKEIRALITDSVKSVADGSEFAAQAGGAMQEVVQTVQRVSDMIADISRASSGAANGLTEIGGSIVHIDGMTQQNAALVEQAAAAAESLRAQTLDIERMIQRFQIHERR